MKKQIIFLISVLLTVNLFSQAPQKMSYQAVIRNANNVLVNSSNIGMRISILQGSATGTPVYVETQTPTTNAFGLVSLEIGTGTIITGTFSSINWANGPYFIKTETDPTGGINYTIVGTSEFLSVPYALYSLNSTAGPIGPPGATGPAGKDGSIGNGLALQFNCTVPSPSNATTYYMGGSNSTAGSYRKVIIPKSGTIKACYISVVTGGCGNTSETSSLYLLTNSGEILIGNNLLISCSSQPIISNITLNQNVTAGDYLLIKWVTPTWASRGAAYVDFSGVVYIE